MFLRVKGVSDIFLNMPFWNGVRSKIEKHLKKYNYSEIEIPILEYLSLFERGLGYGTEVVGKQMFIVESKGKSSEKICLRPEATAGTIRAFIEQRPSLVEPLKTFSCGSMFRYERPQKGRLRQFHQMNIEMIGASSILYDAWMIKMMYTLFLEEFDIDSFVLKINFLGEVEDRKKHSSELVKFFGSKKSELCENCVNRLESNPLRILDCKNESCQKSAVGAPKLFDFFSEDTLSEWKQLTEVLEDLSVTFIHDQSLVRGLDYYNKTVFEFTSDVLGAQSAFCGGGRYDGLGEQLGSKSKIPAIGCGIGMERLLLILESKRTDLEEKKSSLCCIIPIDKTQESLALLLADNLQAAGKVVEILLDGNKVKSKMKKASNLSAQFVALIGEDEVENGTVTLKNMLSGKEQVVKQVDLFKFI